MKFTGPIAVILLLCLAISCANDSTNNSTTNSTTSSTINTLSEQEKKEGWMLLFDGHSLKGWHPYNHQGSTAIWKVQDGELRRDSATKTIESADLVTDDVFTNYDLRFEWKIAKAGNSGVFINVQEDTAYIRTWNTGPEYQLLDNSNVQDHNYGDPKRQSGALYGLVPIKNNANAKPYTEWNKARILQENGKITFWLNDVISVEEDLKSERWRQLVDSSSLGKLPAFGKATSGRIALQDWAKGVSFRNMKIRVLK